MMAVCAVYGLHAEAAAPEAAKKPAEAKEAVKSSCPIVFTEAACKELKSQANKKWLISYNGTCGDAPALGFYQDDGEAGSGDLQVQQNGLKIRIEQKLVALSGEWGVITVDCTDYNGDKPGGKQYVAEFKAKR